jgi:hypothetical protein
MPRGGRVPTGTILGICVIVILKKFYMYSFATQIFLLTLHFGFNKNDEKSKKLFSSLKNQNIMSLRYNTWI